MPEIEIINKSLFYISGNITTKYVMQQKYNGNSYNRLIKDNYPKKQNQFLNVQILMLILLICKNGNPKKYAGSLLKDNIYDWTH